MSATIPAMTKIVNPWLFGDSGQSGAPDSLPIPTQVNKVNVSAFLELQSPKRGLGFLNSRLTTAQINAMTVVNGMQAYNSTTNSMMAYVNGSWQNLNSSALVFPNAVPVSTSSFIITTNGAVTYNSQPIIHVSGTLLTADMQSINTTSVQVLPAPGAGLMYLIDSVYFEVLSTGNTPFATGGAVSLQYGTGAANTNFASASTAAAFFNQAANFTITALGNVNGTTGLASATVTNAAVAIGGAANFTNGAGTSVNYTVYYRVVPVT